MTTKKAKHQSALLGVQYVYYIYDEGGALLYVGVTGNLKQRMNSHRHTKNWWPADPRVEVEEFPDRHAAEAREDELIKTLCPPYNQPPRPLIFARVDPLLLTAIDQIRGETTRARFLELALAGEVERLRGHPAPLVRDQL